MVHKVFRKLFRTSMFATVSLFFFAPSGGVAATLDQPHDVGFGLGCLSCHDMAAFDQPNLIPDIAHVPGDIDDTQYNNICWSCHDDLTAPYRVTHSSLTSSNKYGDWTVQCIVCHNQHSQEQDDAFGTTYGMFIRRDIDLSKISGLVKSGVKSVKFTGPADMADGDATIDGICEVCHTQTTHWRNDGTLAGIGVHTGLEGSDCTACHVHGSGFNVAPHAHTVSMGAGDVSQESGTPCSSCHDDNGGALSAWDDILIEHLNACGTCHNATRDTSKSGSYSIGQTIPDVITAAANPTNCSACHRDKIDSISADATHGSIDHAVAGKVTGVAQCTGCHDQGGIGTDAYFIGTIHNASGNGCGTCHVSPSGGGPLHDYGSGGSTLGDNINYEAINGGAGGTCVDCHTPYSADFQNAHNTADHQSEAAADILAGTANCTTTCHTQATAADIVATTHATNGCTNCHTNMTTDGTLRVGANSNGDATGHTIDSASSCADCHGAYSTNYQTAHDNPDHTGIATTANCTTTCHAAATVDNIINDIHFGGCTTCHLNDATDGTLMPGTYGTAENGAGNCAFCHSSYNTDFTTHVTEDHKSEALADILTASANCTTTCHDGSSLANILTVTHTGCNSCHTDSAADGTLRNAANGNAASHTIDSASSCASCHTDYDTNYQTAHDVKDHDGVTAGGNCTTNCHTGDIVNTTAAPDVHQDTCTNCHTNNALDGTLKVGPTPNGSAAGGSGTCSDCHGTPYDYDTQFDTAHDIKDHNGVTGTAGTYNCMAAGCHTGDIVNTDATPDIHNDTCTNCHTNTGNNGYFRAGTRGDATGGSGNCASCHSDHDGSFYFHNTDHIIIAVTVVNANDPGVPTVDCVGCHTGDLITAVHDLASAGGTAPCAKCHDTDGALTGSAIGKNGLANKCADCHTTYFNAHDHGVDNAQDSGTAPDHDVAMAGDTASGQPCNDCHNTFNDNWSGTNDIAALHTGGCAMCHNSFRDATPIAAGTDTIQDVIATYNTITCLTCHDDRSTTHMDHLTYDGGAGAGVVKATASCMTCHDQGGIATEGHYIGTIHGANSCQTCHQAAGGGGPLHDYSGGGNLVNDSVNYEAINGGHGGECVTCHARYGTDYANHDGENHQTTGLADVIGDTASCVTCHAGADSIVNVHNNNCNACHTAVTGVLKAGPNGNGTAAGHTINTTNVCADCHGAYNTAYTNHDYATPHDSFAETASCGTCHANTGGNNIMTAIHNNTCSTCHTAVTGVLKAGANGWGTAAGQVVGTSKLCANCHSDHNTDYVNHFNEDHKSTGLADILTPSATCTDYCHKQTTAAAIVSTTHATNGCTNCHTATTGVLKAGANGNGTAAGHVINSASTCISCHGDYNTSFDVGHDDPDSHATVIATSSATPTLNCGGCHTGDLINGAANHGKTNQCENCHVNRDSDGRFRSGPLGSATGHTLGVNSQCTDCHGSFVFSNHSHTHTVALGAGDQSQNSGTSCGTAGCHNDTGGLLSTWNDIYVEHLSSCATCHNSTRDTSLSGTYSVGSTIQDIIAANGNPTNCADCHRDKIDSIAADASHGSIDHVVSGVVTNAGSAYCTNCHDSGGVGTNDYYINTIHDVGGANTCGICHQSASGGGPLREPWESADYGNGVGKGGGCADCHNADFTVVHPTSVDHTGFLTWASGGGTLGSRTCQVCHDPNTENLDVQKWVHNSNCASCHDSQGNLIGSATTYGSPSANCVECHTSMTKAQHHATPEAQAGMCHYCHFADTSKVDETGQMPKQPPCAMCHITSDASNFKVNAQVYTPDQETSATWSNPSINPGMVATEVASHAIAAQGTPIQVYDYRACFACHADPAIVGAALVVRPYHGRPYGPLTSDGPQSPGDPDDITTITYHMLWNAPGRTTTTATKLDIMANPVSQGVVDYQGNAFVNWWGDRQYARGFLAQPYTKNNYDEGLSQNIKPTLTTIPFDDFVTGNVSAVNVKVPMNADIAFPMAEEVFVVNATHDYRLGSNNLVVWAKNIVPGATLTVDYNGNTYPMTETFTNKYEAQITDATYVSTVRVFSSSVSANSDKTVPVTNVAPPAAIDYITIVKADWTTGGITNANGTCTGATNGGCLEIWATHTNNDGVNSFRATYSEATNWNLTWNGGMSRYEGAIDVSFIGGSVSVDSPDPSTGTNTKPVTDIDSAQDTVTITNADWDTINYGQIYIRVTHTNNDGVKTYYARYSNGGYATDELMTWNGTAYEVTLTNTGATVPGDGTRPTFPAGNVQVLSYDVGGDNKTTAATDISAAFDTLTVLKADWDDKSGGTIYAWASHTDNNGAKNYYIRYNGKAPILMTWNPTDSRYEAVQSVVGTPFPGGNIVLYSTDSGGDYQQVPAESIASNTPDHLNLGYVTWANDNNYCFECHNSDGLRHVIDDVHMGSCTECHNFDPFSEVPGTANYRAGETIPNLTDADGSTPVTFPASRDFSPATGTPMTCDECHYAFRSNPTWYVNDLDNSSITTGIAYSAGEDTWEDADADGIYDAGETQLSDGGNGWETADQTAGVQGGRRKTWHHHNSDNTQKGNCTHCHTNGSTWTQVPKQAPCAYCHINYGTSDFQLQTFNFNVQTDYNTVITSTPSDTHTIYNKGAAVRPYDYKVCFDCHDGSDTSGGLQAPMVRPYHASGIGLALNQTTITNQGGIPLDFTPGQGVFVEPAGGDGTNPDFNPQENSPTFESGYTRSNDKFYAYYHHPGRGGIIDSTSVLANGSFNILYAQMNEIDKYYQQGDPVGSVVTNKKHFYEGTQTGGSAKKPTPSAAELATPNAGPETVNGQQFNFSGSKTITYIENFAGHIGTGQTEYTGVKIPMFADPAQVPQVPDTVKIIRATYNTALGKLRVWATTVLSTDGYLGDTAPGAVTISYGAVTNAPMTWNSTDNRWEYSASEGANPGSVTVDSSMGTTGTSSWPVADL